jgi:D-serine deaminase-like pyridoxal phosphate-dependent protein
LQSWKEKTKDLGLASEVLCGSLSRSLTMRTAKLRLQQRRKDIPAVADHHLDQMVQFLDDHGDQALRYLRKKGMGTHRRGSNSASGMRLLRRLEKNHDGIRSATTRQPYIQIYQAIKSLSLDIADVIEKGPQMTDPPRV